MGIQKERTTHIGTIVLSGVALVAMVALLSRTGRSDETSWVAQQGNNMRIRAMSALAGFAACSDSSETSEPACKVSHQYTSSEYEQLWLGNIRTWQADFCNNLKHTEELTQAWLKAQAAYHAALQQGTAKNPLDVLAEQQLLDPRIFSQFKTTIDCGSRGSSEQLTWIEPLAHGLRHPNSMCSRGTTVFNRTYLVLAHSSEANSLRDSSHQTCTGRPCQTLYFDLGATTLKPTPDEPGQGWYFDTYAKQGFKFDRYLLWEAKVQDPQEIYKHVPKADIEKYQYFNVPVSADTKDPSSPINILKRVAQPGDFVVFKLDIDNWAIEGALMEALRADPATLSLIDEFFHEDHVNFAEMMYWWDWNGSKQYDPKRTMADSYQHFLQLRQQGIRAHSWV